MLLTKGLYGSEFSPKKAAPFGLRCGQIAGMGEIGHNAGWYNALGEKIGWGDLSPQNALRIMSEVPEGELFITTSEHASYWAFTSLALGKEKQMAQGLSEEAPGPKYVARNFRFAFGREIAYINDPDQYHAKHGEIYTYQDIDFMSFNDKELLKLMKHYSKQL